MQGAEEVNQGLLSAGGKGSACTESLRGSELRWGCPGGWQDRGTCSSHRVLPLLQAGKQELGPRNRTMKIPMLPIPTQELSWDSGKKTSQYPLQLQTPYVSIDTPAPIQEHYVKTADSSPVSQMAPKVIVLSESLKVHLLKAHQAAQTTRPLELLLSHHCLTRNVPS